jgi:hypothetical protein
MSTVFQLTAFLTISLLAIDVTVFVLGVSLLGRAMRRAAEAKQKAEEEKRKSTGKELEALKKSVEECAANPGKVAELGRSVKNLEAKQRKHVAHIKRIAKTASLLTVKGGVVYPGVLLLSALALTLLAAVGDQSRWQVPSLPSIPVLFWLMAIGLMSWAMAVILRVLSTIQDVAITSDEAALRATVDALTLALQAHDDSKTPTLKLVLENPKPPTLLTANSESTIEFALSLTKGQVARNAEIIFMSAPGEFSFPKLPMFKQSSSSFLSGYSSAMVLCGDVRGSIYTQVALVAMSPSVPGKYKLHYRLACDGYVSPDQEIELAVTEGKAA